MESILSMISMCRGSSLDITATGHFSSASGMTVWLVNASVCTHGCACQLQLYMQLARQLRSKLSWEALARLASSTACSRTARCEQCFQAFNRQADSSCQGQCILLHSHV